MDHPKLHDDDSLIETMIRNVGIVQKIRLVTKILVAGGTTNVSPHQSYDVFYTSRIAERGTYGPIGLVTESVASDYFQFLFAEMKLQPTRIQRYPSTVADCSQSTCAGRCIDRSGNMGVWCLPASPKTIWVSPTGSDELNDGISAPLATIQRGIHYASDGDTVELMPGTYTGGGL